MFNYDYELFSAIMLAVLYYALRIRYSDSEMMRNYLSFLRILLLATILDVLTAVIMTHYPGFPYRLNVALNTLYFISEAYAAFSFYNYTENYVKGRDIRKRNLNLRINAIVLVIAFIVILTTPYTRAVFFFDENGIYRHGALFSVTIMISMYFIVNGMFLLFFHRKQLERRMYLALGGFVILELIAIVAQTVLFPDLLITYCVTAMFALMTAFVMETPDYVQLLRTMEELTKAREEADAANKAKSSFLTNMSHEIRTPINGVLGMNTMILKESRDPQILEYAKNIESAGRSLLSLINDVLDISKVEAGKMEIVESEYSLGKLLLDCHNMVYVRANDKGLELRVKNDPQLPAELYGDEVRVRQVISNVLTNAVKYTREGYVELRVSQRELGEDRIMLVVEVEDTGIGISRENQEKIFDAFQRVDESANRNIEGTGMGLRIARQLTAKMGGIIRVSSEVGKGTIFTIELPQGVRGTEKMGSYAQYRESMRAEQMVSAASFRAPNARILVVDDVPMNLKVIRGLLKETQIQVEEASGGMECLEKVQKQSYDMVFLDHLMPEMDGIETLNRMHQLESCPNAQTPMIMLTANAISGAREQYLWAGFSEYLTKPVRENDLCRLLVRYLPKDLLIWKEGAGPEPEDAEAEEAKTENTKALQSPEESTSPEAEEREPQQGQEVLEKSRATGPGKGEEMSSLAERFPSLNTETGLEYCGGMEDFYLEMIQEFLNLELVEVLRKEKNEKDWKNYRVHAHSLKSSARTIGAEKFAELAYGLEQAGANEDEAYADAHQEEVFTALGVLRAELEQGLKD
ncbi:MAG: response regulator [Lachnospiraceae bacterium]|nr:response regulator [Lachnospiraceae bacterium]